jgi:uncharacterized protein with HEPN domain
MNKDKTYLNHIVDAISDAESFVEGLNEEEFLKNKEKQYAVLKAIEIIGEATKNLSVELKRNNHQVPWRDISGMRDKLIHDYFGVKLGLVWSTTKDKLPELRIEIRKILKEM